MTSRRAGLSLAVWLTAGVAAVAAQGGAPGLAPSPLPDEPFVVETAEVSRVRVVPVTTGLSHPWALVFLPDGDLLVTERAGRLRRIGSNGLDPRPIDGVPAVHARGLAGLMDLALDPAFETTGLLFLSYSKPDADGVRVAIARGRLEGDRLADVEDIFTSDPVSEGGTAASRLAFGPDGYLYATVGGAFGLGAAGRRAQDLGSAVGKVIRLRDDGSVPDDNPFVAHPGARPEIYSLGHRNQLGLAVHPATGVVWAHENGPQGGDEANRIRAGGNYGWPIVSYGRQYSGSRVASRSWAEGMEEADVVWIPAVAPSGMVFYDGDRFPAWTGNLFVGALRVGGINGTGRVERVVFNADGQEIRREALLGDLRQRIRDVRQGPDGLLYVVTDADEAAVLRLEPAP